ncbi:MAG: amidohydrolase family protein [Gammaproteobacteria bacterium]|nr:amidohydrolase family protein [Gammaproteobacteria bacterium]
MGTDTNNPYVFPGYSVHVGLELLVESGMSPMAVLIAGTRAAAEILVHEADYGTLEPGKRADILLLDDNPLEAFGRRACCRQ